MEQAQQQQKQIYPNFIVKKEGEEKTLFTSTGLRDARKFLAEIKSEMPESVFYIHEIQAK